MNKHSASFIHRNGLSLALLALFVVSLAGQIWTGLRTFNAELAQSGAAALTLGQYLHSGHFVSATFENWESEFLQMGMYVLLTVVLRQRGSAESRKLEPDAEVDEIEPGTPPWPVRRGGVWKVLYANSLSLAYLVLFALAFAGHCYGSWRHENQQRALEGQAGIGIDDHLGSARFWFESMQNWQSEFLAVLSIVLLSIYLRQKDSPESKPVEAPHSQTGT